MLEIENVPMYPDRCRKWAARISRSKKNLSEGKIQQSDYDRLMSDMKAELCYEDIQSVLEILF